MLKIVGAARGNVNDMITFTEEEQKIYNNKLLENSALVWDAGENLTPEGFPINANGSNKITWLCKEVTW